MKRELQRMEQELEAELVGMDRDELMASLKKEVTLSERALLSGLNAGPPSGKSTSAGEGGQSILNPCSLFSSTESVSLLYLLSGTVISVPVHARARIKLQI